MERTVDQLVQQWTDAEVRADADALAQLLTDDFIGIGPRGFTLTKEQWLARYRSGELRNESIRLEEPAVRSYGDTAVVIARQVQGTFYKDQDVGGQFRATLILVRQMGNWRIAGWQASGPIPEMPPGRG
jgi:ketosteroid isomerase-like protein